MATEAARAAAPAPAVRTARAERIEGLAVGAAVFLSGAVLLGVEIAASRVLAPYFGNSLFVWGALIGVVLTGLSLGYWAGGALADRLPAATLLLGVIGLGAFCVLAVPLVDEAVLEAIVSWDPGPRLNPLVAAVALFGPVSIVLAAVTPVAVRLRMRSVARAGRTAGRLFSVSTAGSIAGTFATAFFLIPEVGVDELFELGAATLLVAAAVVAFLARETLAVVVALALAAGAGYMAYAERPQTGERLTGAAARNWSPLYRTRGYGHLDARDARVGVEDGSLEVVFAEDTQYHRLAVVDDETTRYLRFDNSLQSAMYLEDPFRTRFRYTDYFHLGLAYNPDARNVLFIGLGAGSSPKRMWREFSDLRLHVVELDPVVVDVGYRFFSVPRDERLRVEVGDGRQFLTRSERPWDVIVIDAFFADAIPFHLVTQEFLGLARERLAPGGVVVTNAIGALAGPGSRLFRSIYRTYRTAFPTVLVHPAVEQSDRGAEAYRNLILVATEAAAPEKDFLAERWAALRRRVPEAPDLEGPIRGRHDAPIPTDDVPTLTDDYAPTDALLLLFQ
jgi:spermidine synthase